MFVITLITGFFLGLSVPAVASRFGKILPADPGLICASLWHKPCFPKVPFDEARTRLLKKKWKKLILFSFIWGVVLSLLFGACYLVIRPEMFWFGCMFLFLIAMLMVVDEQYYLLPDFFTIPLLLLGITAAHVVPSGFLPPAESLAGAWFGYLLSTVTVFIMAFFKKAEFGAGDVKMLTALGIWFGVLGLNYALILSFCFFYLCSVYKKQTTGAFGPALGTASILVFFYLYMNLW